MCPVERLLPKNGLGFENSVRLHRHSHHITRTESDTTVGNEQQFFTVRQPVGLCMHVPRAEVIPVLAKAVVASQGDLFTRPHAVADCAHIDVEIPVRGARNVSYSTTV